MVEKIESLPMARLTRLTAVAVAGLLLAGLVPLAADSFTVKRIAPRFMDAEQLVTMLWGPETRAMDGADFLQQFATDLIYDAADRMPRNEGRWVQGSDTRTYPSKSGGLSRMLPDGIYGRPLVIASQNAMVVKGTRRAIEELEELISLFDRPVDMVNVEVRSVDLPEQEVEGWGLAWFWTRGDLRASGGGDQAAGGVQVRLAYEDTSVALSAIETSSRGRHVQGANVTTFNNSPAIVVFSETMPFFTTVTEYDVFGNRVATRQEINEIFMGIQLWVLPRINADDTVTMQLEPELAEWVGEVSIPFSSPIPITRHQTVRTIVTVADGESMVIGGLLRDTDEINEKFGGMFSRHYRRMTSHPVLVVTPKIVRHQAVR